MDAGAQEPHLRGDTAIAPAAIKTLRLKKKDDRRLRRGHPWAFSNEVEAGLSDVEPGEAVHLADHEGRYVGTGYANPHSLIAVRIITRTKEEVGPALIRRRIEAAKRLRDRLCPGRDTYRAFYSESDFLPGLVVDRYDDRLSVQSLTAGMERLLPDALDALEAVYSPACIVLRNDAPLRALEGLPLEKKVARGRYGGRPAEVELAGLRFSVDILEGQKTGFFLDQVDNYALLERVSEGSDTLDLFCHTGAWGLCALLHGAKGSMFVDSSAQAVAAAEGNARINGLEKKAEFVREDAFTALKRLIGSGRTFGLVVSDPPAFIKSRSRLAEGVKGYVDLNAKAMRAVSPGGWLVSCSCSHHLDREGFLDVLKRSASGAGRTARLLELRSQSKDHPVLLAAPETEYLKCALLQIL